MFKDFVKAPVTFLSVSLVIIMLIVASVWGWYMEYGLSVKGVIFIAMSVPLELILSILPGAAMVFLLNGRVFKATIMAGSAIIVFQFTNLGTINFLHQLDKGAVTETAKLDVTISDLKADVIKYTKEIEEVKTQAAIVAAPFQNTVKEIQKEFPGTFGPLQKEAQSRIDDTFEKRDAKLAELNTKLEQAQKGLANAKTRKLDQNIIGDEVTDNFFMVLQYVNVLGYALVAVISTRNVRSENREKKTIKSTLEEIKTKIVDTVPHADKVIKTDLAPKSAREAVANRKRNRVPTAPRRDTKDETVIHLQFVKPETATKRRTKNKPKD